MDTDILTKKFSKNEDNRALSLCFLAWQDALERLETLILESRHLQENIIYSLGESEMYRLLAYEENYIWKNSHHTSVINRVKEWSKAVAAKGVPLFPSAYSVKFNTFTRDKLQELRQCVDKIEIKDDINHILKSIEFRVMDRWLNNRWSQDDRRHYHCLRAVQVLKRNIFADKLYLNEWGLFTFDINKINEINFPNPDWDKVVRFIFLRGAIMERIRNYVARLGDLQAQFSRSQDMGLQDHPHPLVERRREQNVYIRFLSERSRDMMLELGIFWRKLSQGTSESISNRFIYKSSTMHRWQHQFTSETYSIHDQISNRDPMWVHFINTSYFMPERPDLLCGIAHEAVHAFIREFMDDMEEYKLSSQNDRFSEILKHIYKVISVERVINLFGDDQGYLLSEIAADLLALIIRGPAFLHAMFLELISLRLESFFFDGRESIDLDSVLYFERSLNHHDCEFLISWLRIIVACEWLSAIWPFDSSNKKSSNDPMTPSLISSIRKIVHHMSEFAARFSTGESRDNIRLWQEVCNQLSRYIQKMGKAGYLDVFKDWIRYDQGRDPSSKSEIYTPIQPLPTVVREFLFKGFLERKFEFLKSSRSSPQASTDDKFKIIKKLFNNIYGIDFSYKSDNIRDSNLMDDINFLFRHIYDIPWQCSILKSYDFVSGCILSDNNNIFSTIGIEPNQEKSYQEIWLDKMHFKFAMGRELYQIAVYFLLHDINNSIQHYSEIYRLVEEYCCRMRYDNWLINSGNSIPNDKYPFNVATRNFDLIKLEKWLKQDLDSTQNPTKKVSKGTILEIANLNHKLSLKKQELRDLFEIINESHNGILIHDLAPIHNFLNTSYMNKPHKSYDFIIKAMEHPPTDQSDERLFPYHSLCMIGRVAHSSTYHLVDSPGTPHTFSDTKWLLGRYDKLIIQPNARPLIRTELKTHLIHRMEKRSTKDEPEIHKEDINPLGPDLYVPFFVRWETAVPLRLNFDCTLNLEKLSQKNTLAYLSVIFNRSSARFDFLKRLLHIINTNNHGYCSPLGKPVYIEHLKSYFRINDLAFCSNGFAGLLFAFSKDDSSDKDDPIPIVNRIHELFEIQDIFMQDHLVRRTELIFSEECFGPALYFPQDFELDIRIRMTPDRYLNLGHREFVKHLTQKADEYLKPYGLKCFITRTPGRLDYYIRFAHLMYCEITTRPDCNFSYMDFLMEVILPAPVAINDSENGDKCVRIINEYQSRVDKVQTTLHLIEKPFPSDE